MGEKIVVGPINKGLTNDRLPFVIDNDAFPTLTNAYQWRGRIKRKRGTSFLGRLTRFFNSLSTSYSSTTTITLNGSGVGNLLTGFSLQTNGNVVPGSVTLTGPGGPFTDPTMNGYLTPTGTGGVNTINYATGVITIPAKAGSSYSATFLYYPDLPVMGLEDLILELNQFPQTLGFDTKYSYNISTADPYPIYDVSFYKNPPADPTNLPGYIQKTTVTPTSWNGQDYQQFWTVNYEGALWATNGINIPFSTTNVGMQFKLITNVAIITAGNGTTIPAVADISIVGHGLVQGDFLFINEVVGITGINFQTGYVTSADPQNPNLVRVTFPFAILGGAYTSGGIAQYLTNRSDTTVDCIRWYDGDPTDGNATTPTLNGNKGWVNFAPPLSNLPYSIAGKPAAIYYLVGARMIVPFKDRLLFLGPVIQTSGGSKLYLQDTVIYSQNGTPYYTASFNGDVLLTTTTFHPVLVPTSHTATASAYFEDVTGFGGFVSAAIDEAIVTCNNNEDVLLMGFDEESQSRFVYTGNDVLPFEFFLVSSDLPSSSTFSVINMNRTVLTIGDRGIIQTTQTAADRIDLDIPDEVFEISLLNNGTERTTAIRDYINEWVYFTYSVNIEEVSGFKFPNQTLQYNYRDNSWAIFQECYTTYGTFRRRTGFIWSTVGRTYPTWASWSEPWNAGSSTLLEPQIIAGNQQGFVIFRDDGGAESKSLYIRSISGSVVNVPDHTLNEGDFIIISDAIGTISSQINGRIFSVEAPITSNSFTLNANIGSGTYFGGGLITRLYRPYIQSRQFPPSWGLARKTRLGPQQYLISKTNTSQITLLIFLSQDGSNSYNDSPIIPATNVTNSSLLYSTILYTCPESTNLGLTPANVNLQMPTAVDQNQIWHRINTSLLGDTIQVGFTLSDLQMSSFTPQRAPVAITGATQAYPCVISTTANFQVGQMIKITDIVGMIELNNNTYQVIATSSTTAAIDVDATTFTAYVSGGNATLVAAIDQFAEIEIHGFILDVSSASLLA